MSPFAAAGALAAAYDLGLLHRAAPDTFGRGEGMDLRTALIAGLLGYGVGSDGKAEVEHANAVTRQDLLAALQRSHQLLLQERAVAAQREQALHEALMHSEQQRQLQAVAARAQIEMNKGKRPA